MFFVTSDQHFFHKNIIKLKGRPFSDVNEMSQFLIQQWNAVVTDNDTIFILGDFIGKEPVKDLDIEQIANRLKGDKVLIKGNHDKNYSMKKIFSHVYERGHVHCVIYKDTMFKMNHWLDNMTVEGDFPDTLYLHGHKHNKKAYNVLNVYKSRPYFDVGVDANNFSPISFDEILEKFNDPPQELPKFRCRKCNALMQECLSKYGPFLRCSRYPDCKFTVDMGIDRRTSEEKNLMRIQRKLL